ncbi:MAG TPA: hypothetical protein VHP36_01790 [Chitinispirillaceae bacterium]|nr:hypothetical protein [Chitinispirillaceae bacterium]
MYNENDPMSVEKYSSAVTLSDMEVFIFPELMLSLVMANIMSPRLWQWKSDPWFEKIEKLSPLRRLQRLKQYIMDHFSFNLDLDTWGLTTKEKELARFNAFINESVLSQSNALFGYEGDKYYFDIDIRKHFGLDKYNSDIIPYWKTETLEAMEAFKYKEGYPTGAGECVSLAALYAASSVVLAGIPLDDIYMLATPLHSQNFLEIGDGVLTNNRRIVTKTMWFNGTEISAKARRALDNEKITIVAHSSGYIHTLYNSATISPSLYKQFQTKLRKYLKTDINFEILTNFLRHNSCLQKCFQIAHSCCGKPRYIEAEKVYQYEHSSKSRVGDSTQNNLLHEIEEDEFYTSPLPERIMLSDLESFFKNNHVSIEDFSTVEKLKLYLCNNCISIDKVIQDLKKFCTTEPLLPDTGKKWESVQPLNLDNVKCAEDAIARMQELRNVNITADLAFTAFRDLKRSSWKPFLKAALERNPVSVSNTSNLSLIDAFSKLSSFENSSIYPEASRLAQPDEVWNYQRGDGLEKAICLVNIIKNRYPDQIPELNRIGNNVYVIHESKEYKFPTLKDVQMPEKKDF